LKASVVVGYSIVSPVHVTSNATTTTCQYQSLILRCVIPVTLSKQQERAK